MKTKSRFIKTRTKQNPFNLKKYLTIRNLLIFLLLVVLYIVIPSYTQAIILIIIFYPISMFTARLSKYVRTMNLNLLESFTIFLSIVYGWKIALFFGGVLGTYIWMQVGMNQKTMTNCLMTYFSAFIGQWMFTLIPNSFLWAYISAAMIRNLLTFLVFLLVNPNIFHNLNHLICDIFKTIMMSSILKFLYDFLLLIS
ncbi:hypothetical protein JXB41_07575 [Candidatus Woesearchaeota archaeon]|nr:hypothetical protein [Candidatus Woesearchaeota archaeon]